VIALTEELLATAKQNENSTLGTGTSASTSDILQNSNATSQYEMVTLIFFNVNTCFGNGFLVLSGLRSPYDYKHS